MVGKVVRVHVDRGFGFIQPEDQSRDVFFHCRQLYCLDFDERLLNRRVVFDVEEKAPTVPRAGRRRKAEAPAVESA